MRNFFILLFSIFIIFSCSKKEPEALSTPSNQDEAIKIYREGLKDLEDGQFFLARKKFVNRKFITSTQWAAKSALMSSFCLYSMNFYDDAILNLRRFTKTYPADANIDYANYLIAISYYEQILDEDKDIEPLILSKNEIEKFIDKYPNTDYALDLKFKLDLIINQMAAKELSIARYYIKNEKWIPAINRLKVIVEKYDKTIFIEEALFRLVEIYYRIGLVDEAKAAASMLGYNYNSSEWYERSYKILNKNYQPVIIKKENKEGSLVTRTLKRILFIDEKSGKN